MTILLTIAVIILAIVLFALCIVVGKMIRFAMGFLNGLAHSLTKKE